MSALLNLVDQNADTLQQMALLAYVKDPELGEPFLEAITTYKVSIFLTRLIYRNLLIVYNRIHTFFIKPIYGVNIELVSKELNHFGVIAGLFRQIGVIVVDLCYFALFEDFSL